MTAGFWDRSDDWVNPIVVKELRQAVQSRLVIAAVLLFLGLQLFVLGAMLFVNQAKVTGTDGIDFRMGRQAFFALQMILLGSCMLLVPAYAGVRLGVERSDTNTDLLFISTLKPRSIIAGKFFAAVVLTLLIFSACAPFMVFTYLLRGLDIPSILLVLLTDFVAVLAGTMVALFLGSLPGNRALRGFLGMAGAFALLFLFGIATSISVALVEEGARFEFEGWEFWGIVGSLVGLVFAAVGLLFVWAVALVSPQSANRAVAGRVYLILLVAVTGALAFGWTYKYDLPPPMWVWEIGAVILGSLQILIAINERETWSPRVTKTIPRNPLSRAIAFLTFSGSAGGVLLGVLICGTAIGLTEYVVRTLPMAGFRLGKVDNTVTEVMGAIALYTYCYALSGVLVRRWVMPAVKPLYTWIVTGVLAGLGSTLPYLIAFFLYWDFRVLRYENPWWVVTNPITVVMEIGAENEGFISAGYLLTGIWALGVTLFALPWFTAQVRAFKPFARKAGDSGLTAKAADAVGDVQPAIP